MHEIKYICGEKAKEFHADKDSRVKLLIGPFGTGKTSSAGYDEIMLQSHGVLPDKNNVKKTRFAVVRNTYPQLRDTTIKTVLDWFPPEVFGGVYLANDKIATYNIEDEDGTIRNIEILFRALDIPKDVRNLLSLELTGAWCDEAREIQHDIFKGLLGRVGRYPSVKDFDGANPFVRAPQIALTTNYPSREHWLYRDFVQTPVDGYSIYEQKQKDNKHNLRPNYYEDLEKDYADRPDLLRTLVRGEWGVTVRGKQIYTEFDRGVHVSPEPLLPFAIEGANNGRQIIRGWDNTGLSPACVLMYQNTVGQTYIFKEFCGEDIGIVDFGEAVKAFCEEHFNGDDDGTPFYNYRDIGDPAGRMRDSIKRSAASYMAEHLNIRVQDGIQTFKVRRESVANRLNRSVKGEPAVLVDPGCIRLIDGFEGGYAYPEIGSTGQFKTDPDKNEYSHIHDALQYPFSILYGHRDDDTDMEEPDYHEGRNDSGGY